MAALLKYKLFLIFGGLMLVEGLVLFFMLSGSSTSTTASEEAMVEEAQAQAEFIEFDLGDPFKVSNSSVEGSPMRIDCKMFAEVPKEYEPKFLEAYEAKKHRVRDAVQAVIRGASYADITDPDLGAIKRKLKKAIADVIGTEKPYISQVIVSDFQSYEL
jgi:flagellar basal body-associated protein FliL